VIVPSWSSVVHWTMRISRHHAPALRVVGCFCVVFLATIWVGIEDSGNLIWMANGLLLAYLLLAPRWRWPAYLSAGYAAEFLGGSLLYPGRWIIYLTLAIINITEVAIGAFLLRRRSTQLPQFTARDYLVRFLAFAVIVGPFSAGILFALAYAYLIKSPPWLPFLRWITTDTLGIAIATPAFVAILRTRWKLTDRWRTNSIYAVAVVAVTLGAFTQTRMPVIFLIYPLMAVILLRFGLGWASLGSLFIAACGSWFTIRGVGPFASVVWFPPAGPAILLQLYIASGVFMVYAASTVVDTLRATERKLQEIVEIHRLVTENSRDIIILADFDGHRSFVSAAVEQWDMWTQEEILRHASLDLVHPEDKLKIVPILQRMRNGGEGALIECRIRKRDGAYLWVEASLRPVHDPKSGLPVGLLNMVRNIDERKAAEHELHNAYRALEALAVTDPLTHLANRRRFDQYLTTEWRRAMRERVPLSMLLIDVDWFKSYNDTYGHLRGDSCLNQVAEAAQDTVARPADLVARFGGEEFAVILPDTDPEGAIVVAEQVRQALCRRQLEHRGSPFGFLTVSIGAATVIPNLGQTSATLIQQADDAMYVAKRNGRNQVCSASLNSEAHAVAQAS
jgi:diguanylate cyclase (GGDEF)-like protein/PAS domain S-box-containing protein